MTRIRIWSLFLGLWACSAALSAVPCAPSVTAMCLSGSRFRVEVQWRDFQGNTGSGQAIPLTADTGYFWFFSSSNVELVVKVLDARTFNNKFWVFFGALSNVQYDLTVTDTVSGASKTYRNPAGQFASVGDTAAFDGGSAAAAAKRETVTVAGTATRPDSLESIRKFVASAPSAAASTASTAFKPCPAPVTDLLLNQCRFQLQVSWQDSQGNTGEGEAVQLTDDTGYFWFFSPNNVELVVKVLDARALDGDFWVFFGALSNVQYRLTVTDTLSGAVKIYMNPQGSFASVGDTAAFQPGPSVTVIRDDARSASGDFDQTGGTLTAAAADGTQFVLTLPANALILPTHLTMTPISRIDGLPVGGSLLSAVQIEPDGLFLWTAADLKILPPTPPALGRLTYFRYRGPGESFTPYPGVPNAHTTNIEIPVSYLAGYGAAASAAAASGTPSASVQRANRIAAAGALAPYIARVSVYFKQLVDQEIDFQTYLTNAYAIWDEAWGDVVVPALDGLGSDCNPEVLSSTFQLAFEFLHLDPESDPRFALYNESVLGTVKTKVLDCVEASYQRCKSYNDPSEVLLMLQLQAILQHASLLTEEDNQTITDKIDKCLRFEIDFESALTFQGAGFAEVYEERLKVRATVPLRLEAGEHYRLSGNAPISHEFAEATGTECTYSIATSPGSFIVSNLQAGFLVAGKSRNGAGESLGMVYDPGDPTEILTAACDDATQTGPPVGFFSIFYRALHGDEGRAGLPTELIALDWETVQAGNFLAKKLYTRSMPGVSEETSIFLKHKPQ